MKFIEVHELKQKLMVSTAQICAVKQLSSGCIIYTTGTMIIADESYDEVSFRLFS